MHAARTPRRRSASCKVSEQLIDMSLNHTFCLTVGIFSSRDGKVVARICKSFDTLLCASRERAFSNCWQGSFVFATLQISRETLHGSTGDINGAILSRLFQYQSDGMVGYNQARKIAYVRKLPRFVRPNSMKHTTLTQSLSVSLPAFPFVNAQIIAFFSLSIIFIFPFLYYSFVKHLWFACIMNTLTVLCFLGLHEVARELENPFINVPNDLPLCTFQVSLLNLWVSAGNVLKPWRSDIIVCLIPGSIQRSVGYNVLWLSSRFVVYCRGRGKIARHNMSKSFNSCSSHSSQIHITVRTWDSTARRASLSWLIVV